ncbi:MAG: hypothetical protein KAI67_00820 [Candidatus Pacebacteria bacterium]|nr:hypothetical protein [Candidatus Paceibacterota bacterium]
MNIFQNIKDAFFQVTFFIMFIFCIYSVINIFSYYDPINSCYIRVEGDVVSGNRKTVYDAIKLIKKEDKKTYKVLCQNVERISENECSTAHGEFTEDDKIAWEQDGCYVRGSKVILIKPEKIDSESIIRKRVETIKKYALYSEKFWKEN